MPIIADGSTNTQITQTASGIDQINIATPNANGLSHNKFSDYNVNETGQIINNFSGKNSAEISAGSGLNALTQTQIGGLVVANPNLNSSGSAKIILNEVTSGNISQLLGYIEIAGTNADLILANPNGIMCRGCGFINTARLLNVAGNSNFDANNNLGFNLKEQANPNLYVPLITIDGLGLDATRNSGTEIVASSVKLLASIIGSKNNSLAISTGEGRYDFASKKITQNNPQINSSGDSLGDPLGDPQNPQNSDAVFAIDGSALAKIQAGQIYLIATKQGVGVKMESEILASQTLNLDANGDIYYNKISVGDNANLKSSGTIQTSDSNSKISAPTINITANQFNNSGLVLAQNLNIYDIKNLNNLGDLEALHLKLANLDNIDNSGIIFAENSLNISGKNLTNNASGNIYSPQDYAINLNDLLSNSGLISSAKNLTLNTNQLNNSGEISALNNLDFLITNSLNNLGLISSANNLTLNSNQLNNSGEISALNNLDFLITNSAINSGSLIANNNFNLNLTNNLTNSGILSSLGNFNINGNSNITNDYKILSNGNLNIFAKNLTNNHLIQSNKNLTFNLDSLTNNNNIISGDEFNILALKDVTNSGFLESLKGFNIIAENVSNTGSALILANNNLIISASIIDNQNTKPLTSIITSGIVSRDGEVNLFTDNLKNNSGLVFGKSTSVSALEASKVNLYNSFGAFISTMEISLDLGDIDYILTGDVSAQNIDITANNIINQGHVIALDFIKLNATGNSGIAGSGNITNGFANGDNSNVLLASGTYLNLIAKNNIDNYATILGTTDTTLTATYGNINNYNNGVISAGYQTATLNALNGSFNNAKENSIFTSDNNAILNVKDLNNFGEISIANDLITNITNNLTNNPKALIWIGNNAIFNVANNFLNNQADIYAERNLTIQKNYSQDPTQNKTNLVQNISGSIETFAGDINIKAVTLENKRSSMKSQNYSYWQSGCNYHNHECHYDSVFTASFFGNVGENSTISSGKNISLTLDTLKNDSASILATKDIAINAQTIKNTSPTFEAYQNASYDWWNCCNPYSELTSYKPPATIFINDQLIGYNYYFGYYLRYFNLGDPSAPTSFRGRDAVYSQKEVSNPAYTSESYPALIKSGGALTITQNGFPNSSLINGSDVAQYSSFAGNSKKSKLTEINKIDIYQLGETGVLAVDLSSIISAINDKITSNSKAKISQLDANIEGSQLNNSDSNLAFLGNFKINFDPSSISPLIESRSQFRDVSKFFGSSYYFEQLGMDSSAILADINRQNRTGNIRMLGDSFVESKLIIDQIKNLTNDSLLLSQTISDQNQQIKELLDNAINEFSALGLNAKDVAIKGLTKNQTNSLTKDIVTFELTTINGISVLVPKIYLSQDTRNRILNPNSLVSTTALANSSLANSSLANSSLANSSTIFAKDKLTIDSPNASLSNNGAIVSGGDLFLNISSLTNKTNSIAKAQIIGKNNLSITAQNGDIKNIGAKIEALGNLSLEALKGNILNTAIVQTNDQNLLNQNPDSYQLGFNNIGKVSGNITSTLLQNASLKGGSISISASNDFTNLGAEISATKNILPNENILPDGSNINNQDPINPNIANQDLTTPNIVNQDLINPSTTISNTTSGNISITAGDDINISTLQLRNREESSWGNRKKGGTLVIDQTKNIGSNIESAGSLSLMTTGLGVDSENSGNPQNSNLQGSNIQITGSNLKSSENISITSKDDISIQASQDTSYQASQSWKKGLTVAKSSVSGSESITNNLSTLTSGGNIILTSSSDTNLIGTKLNAENVAISTGEEVNIYSVSDYNKSWASSTKSRNYSSITGGLLGASTPLIYSDPMTVVAMTAIHLGLDTNNSSKSSSNSTEKTSNIASIIEAKNDIAINSNQDLTISGSDISGKTGSLISNQGNVDILSAQEIEKNISSSKSVQRATNVPGLKGSKNNSSVTTEKITNIASNLAFTDSLAIQTNGNSTDLNQSADVNIKGSNLTVSNGDLTIASKGNVIIENAIDSNFKESSSKKINETTKNIAKAVDYVETASSSNLNANNINISSLGDTVIQGSNIKTQENLLIGSFAVAQNPDGSYQKDANGNYLTTTGSAVDNLIIKDAELKEYHYAHKAKGYTGVVGVGVRALPYALAPIEVAVDLTKEALGTFLPQNYENFILDDLKIGEVFNANDKVKDEIGNIKISQTSQTRIDKTNSIASNLDVNGSMMINAVNDVLIKGSNLDISGDLLANSLGSFEVIASKNTESKTTQESFETAGEFHSDFKPSKANYRAGVSKDFVEEGLNSTSSTVASSNLNIGGSALINSFDKFSLIGSNLIGNDSVEIIAKNNLNISDAKNTQSSSSYQEKITLDTGIQVGNAYVDAGNAVIDALKATKEVKDSYDKLEKIKDLKDQGMASSKAVERAEYQVVLALINAGLSSANAMQAVANAGVASSTSLGSGFYGSIYADITKLKSSSTTESSQSISSNLIANNTINLASGKGDINITGSNVSSINGDLNLNSMLGNINIVAGESTYSQSSKTNSRSLGGSIGTNGLSANIGFSESQSSFDQTTFSNSQISAINGNLNINTNQDLKIFGANLIASNVNMNIGNNLLLKSKQNLSESDSYNIGASIGLSGNSGGNPSGINGGSLGLNLGNGYSNRAFVEDISSIIGNNSVNINVANDTNITGALIANQNNQGIDLGNLNLKTKSLTYSDLNNFSVSNSNQLSTNLQAGYNPNNPTQNGNLAIKLNMQGSESSSTTKATIGKGNITINEILNDESKIANLNREINDIEQNKKTVITSDFDSEIKIDLRLIASAGNLMIGNTDKATANWNSYATETKKGFNISYDALAIPLTSLNKTVSGDLDASDALLATGKNYQNLYQLAYNQNIVLEDLAGEGKLITYNGDQLDATAQARYANGFYDRNSETLAINADSNKNDAILAGTLAHEGGHRMFNNNGQSYTLSEENASHMIGNFAESRWDTYQSDNTSLRSSLPTPTLNFSNNFYANNVEFGGEVNPLLYVSKNNLRLIASDGKNDHKVALLNEIEVKQISALYDSLLQALPQSTGLLISYKENNMLDEEASVIKLDTNYQTQGEIYDLTKKSDFQFLTEMTKESGINYSSDLINSIFNQKIQEIDMTNIFYQSGMQNNHNTASKSASLIGDEISRGVGLIINNSAGLNTKSGYAKDVAEYLPNILTLKDVLNGEVYQQIANNGQQKNLIIMHSAGNSDAIKSAQVLALNNVNLNNKIDFISVGSPLSNSELKEIIEPIGGNVIGSYNSMLDPVTHPKTWVLGTAGLFGAGIIYGASAGASATLSGSGLEAYFSGLIGGGIGGGIGAYNIKLNHPFDNYFNKNFKDLKVDIKNWSNNNPILNN